METLECPHVYVQIVDTGSDGFYQHNPDLCTDNNLKALFEM